MTDHQLRFCKACTKKQFDPQQGLLCSLTGRKPDFIDNCPAFQAIKGAEMNVVESTIFDAQLALASNGKRFANYLIDLLVLMALNFSIAFFSAIIVSLFSPESLGDMEDNFNSTLLSWVFSIVILLMYYTFCESVFGRTVGKLVTGTHVVDRQGRLPETSAIFRRSLSRLVPFEAFSFFLGNDPRGWHDEWTDTYVVEKK